MEILILEKSVFFLLPTKGKRTEVAHQTLISKEKDGVQLLQMQKEIISQEKENLEFVKRPVFPMLSKVTALQMI